MLLGLVILFVSSVNSSPIRRDIPPNGLIMETGSGHFYLPPESEYFQNQGQTLPEVDPNYPHISVRLTEDEDKVKMDNDDEGEMSGKDNDVEGEVKPAQTGQVKDSDEEYPVAGTDTQIDQQDNSVIDEVTEEVTEENTNYEGPNQEVSEKDTDTEVVQERDPVDKEKYANNEGANDEITENYTNTHIIQEDNER